MISIVLVFSLSALAAFFAGSLLNGELLPTSNRGPTAVEETTQAPRTENKPEPKTVEKTIPAETQEPKPPATTPEPRPPETTPEPTPPETATATATATATSSP